MTAHKDLANAELHEQKGVAESSDMQMYFSDGSGSGTWQYLLETAGSWTYSTDVSSIEFTDLDDYAFLQIDLSGIELGSNTNQTIFCQVGNDSGYTTSSIYYNNYWSSNIEDTEAIAGLSLGFFRNTAPANSMINISSTLLANFNIERYGIATSQEVMDEDTTTTGGFLQRTQFIREIKAYNKIKIFATDDFTAGTIIVTGYRRKA